MARNETNKLNDRLVKAAKPKDKQYRLPDGRGLFLLVKPNGSKLWRLKFRYTPKGEDKRIEDVLSFGVYPEVSLKEAREKTDVAKKQIEQGIHPRKLEKEQKSEELLLNKKLFKNVAEEWLKINEAKWSPTHFIRLEARIHKNIYPALENRLVDEITPKDIVAILRYIESQNKPEVASRVKQDLNRIFRYAVQTELAQFNPAADMNGVLAVHKAKHHPALNSAQLPQFYKRLSNYSTRARKITVLAIRFMLLTFVRNTEMRKAEWSEFDFDNCLWHLPGERMKMKKPHVVPLCSQSIELLKELKTLSGHSLYLFPGDHNTMQCMSDVTINRALQRMGYDTKTEVTTHGFRTTASSSLNESGLWNADAIERQLAHEEANKVRAAYIHKAEFLDERRKMMQWWGDYLHSVEHGDIVPAKFREVG
jgi:integrase